MVSGTDGSLLARQESLLQGLMREIVRLTEHKTPLEVGVPLFPFSHAGVFRKNEKPRSPPEDASIAPLPVSPPFEEPTPAAVSSSSRRGWSVTSVSPAAQDTEMMPGASSTF